MIQIIIPYSHLNFAPLIFAHPQIWRPLYFRGLIFGGGLIFGILRYAYKNNMYVKPTLRDEKESIDTVRITILYSL